MKHIHYLLIPLALASINVSASNSLPTKQVSIPFTNEAIISANHSGLVFKYDMNGNPTKKIICALSNAYKSWFEFSDQGLFRESATFGGNHIVTFSSKGTDHTQDGNYTSFHADAAGEIKINEVGRGKLSHENVSCFYSVDN